MEIRIITELIKVGRQMKVTIKDIAREANVSTATVSRVLTNKKGTYRPATAERIHKIANQLGYRKNVAASELASKTLNTIAVVINNTKTNFWQSILEGIQKAADKNGKDIVIFNAGNNDPKMLAQSINAALERQVAGILLVATKNNEQQIRTLDAANVPYRLVSIYDLGQQGHRFVSSNNFEIGREATEYLIKNGHQKIGLIGIDHSITGNQRLAGYQQALKNAGITPQDTWVQYGDYSFDNGQTFLDQIQQNRLTAIVAASDLTAAGIIKSANQEGIKLPKDLSIISIDGTFICEIASPQLTSVTQNFYQIGYQGLTSLVNDAGSTFVPVQITKRDSVTSLT